MKSKYYKLLVVVAFVFGSSKMCFAQSTDNSNAIAAADTSNFKVNTESGWQLFNSYVARQGVDSVQLELIVQHDNSVDWTQEQYIGDIKTAGLIPTAAQTAFFTLGETNFSLKIENNGKCYLKLVSGPALSTDPVILPFRVVFKK